MRTVHTIAEARAALASLPAPKTTEVRVAASSAQRVQPRASINRSFSASRRSVALLIAQG